LQKKITKINGSPKQKQNSIKKNHAKNGTQKTKPKKDKKIIFNKKINCPEKIKSN
jgi:hypothetical protein